MPDETYNESEIAMQLSQLDHRRQVAFALSCAERLMLNYRVFEREHKWGNFNVLREGLDFAWDWLAGIDLDLKRLSELSATCEAQAPDTEEFQSRFVSSALDAANAVVAVLALIQTEDPSKAVEVGCLSRDTVDMYVQELENMPANSLDLEERIQLHPLMQIEILRQKQDISELGMGLDLIDAAEKWKNPEVSNIGLS